MGSFRDELLAKEREEAETEERRKRFVERVLRNLPGIVADVLAHFREECRGASVRTESANVPVELSWAHDGSKLGGIQAEELKLEHKQTYLRLRLNPVVGYIGATAKIDLQTNNILASARWPLEKDGLFVKIGAEDGEPNGVFYLGRNKSAQPFGQELVEKILAAVFLADT